MTAPENLLQRLVASASRYCHMKKRRIYRRIAKASVGVSLLYALSYGLTHFEPNWWNIPTYALALFMYVWWVLTYASCR